MPKWLVDLLKAIVGVSVLFFGLLLIKYPKLDAVMKANPPRIYIPLFAVLFVFLVLRAWMSSRKL